MKQMFDISEKLISEQSDEIYGVKTINWKTRHGSICLWLVMNKSSVYCTQRSTYSQILYCVLERWTKTLNQILLGKKNWIGSRVHHNTELWTIDGEPMEFEWNIFPGFNTLQLCHKVQELLSRLSVTPEKFNGRIIFMSMFNDISWGSKDNKKECEANAQLVSLCAKKFGAGQWSFLGPGSEKKWYSISADSPQGEWDKIAELMMLKFGESGHPVFRPTSPLSRGSAWEQRWWKIVVTLLRRLWNDWNCSSHNYFSKSAQSLRSSRRNVWRIWILSRKNGETRCVHRSCQV